jgi:hypothetical protein
LGGAKERLLSEAEYLELPRYHPEVRGRAERESASSAAAASDCETAADVRGRRQNRLRDAFAGCWVVGMRAGR